MRRLLGLGLAALGGVAAAQTPPPAANAVAFVTSRDVRALVDRAKATIKPGQPSLFQPLGEVAPYRTMLEYRVAATPANSHPEEAELVYIVEGGGTVTLGGTIVDAKPSGRNIVGTSIKDGSPRQLAPGDLFLIPKGTPHWFNQINGSMVAITLHLP